MHNSDGKHVALSRLVDGGDARSRFDDSTIPYDEVLGPLRQTAVFAASVIRFGWWPAHYAGVFALTSRPSVILVTEGAVAVESDCGKARTFQAGDVLELVLRDARGPRIKAVGAQPFRAAVIDLDRAPEEGGSAHTRQTSGQSLPYVRNVTGEDERSHFEDGALPYFAERDGALVTEDIAIVRFQYVFASGDLSFDFHNAPQRQIVVPLTGGIRGENGDGTQRVVPPGGVYFGEDTTGQGHITRSLNNDVRFSIFAHLT